MDFARREGDTTNVNVGLNSKESNSKGGRAGGGVSKQPKGKPGPKPGSRKRKKPRSDSEKPKSRQKGVSWDLEQEKWLVRVSVNVRMRAPGCRVLLCC